MKHKTLTTNGFKETVQAGQASTVLTGGDFGNGQYPIMEGTSVNLIPGLGAVAKIEFSLSPLKNVLAESATWQAWPLGEVATPTNDSLLGRVTALRMVTVDGPTTWEVR